MSWEAILPAVVESAADLLIHALGEKKAREKLAERAAILAARTAADHAAAKKFGPPTKP